KYRQVRVAGPEQSSVADAWKSMVNPPQSSAYEHSVTSDRGAIVGATEFITLITCMRVQMPPAGVLSWHQSMTVQVRMILKQAWSSLVRSKTRSSCVAATMSQGPSWRTGKLYGAGRSSGSRAEMSQILVVV